LRRHTAAIPILFAIVTDPVGQGIVASLARPGGNITGFTDFDGPMAGKWLGMMAQIAPPAEHVPIIYNPANAPFADMMMRVIEGFAPPLGMTVRAAPVRNEAGVAAMMATVSPEKHDGLLVLPDGFTIVHRAVIVASAARSRVPAVYWNHVFVADGGLMSYGADNADLFQRAAAYVANAPDGLREPSLARWGLPSPVFALKGRNSDPGVTNVGNVSSPHWRRWLGVESRCVAPFTSSTPQYENEGALIAVYRNPQLSAQLDHRAPWLTGRRITQAIAHVRSVRQQVAEQLPMLAVETLQVILSDHSVISRACVDFHSR